MTRKTPGSELASSLGGAGWASRNATHEDEVTQGRLWRRCGYRCEFARLREVMLCVPPDSLAAVTDPRGMLMREPVNLSALRDQTAGVVKAFECNGVTVRLMRPPPDAPPTCCSYGTVPDDPGRRDMARMAARQRAGEERYATQALAAQGYPILRTVAGTATSRGRTLCGSMPARYWSVRVFAPTPPGSERSVRRCGTRAST